MRSLILTPFLLFLLTSCSLYVQYPILSSSLTNIKFSPTEKEIDVFFVEESKPPKDYIRIALVEKRMAANHARVGQLLEAIRTESSHLGADAVIILKQDTEQTIFYQHESLPYQVMTGIAIRYVDNIEVVEDQLSHIEIISHSNDLREETKVEDNGNLVRNFKSMEAFIAYEYSLHYLLESTENWRFQNSPTLEGNILNRRHVNNQEIIASLKAVQGNDGRYSEIKILRLRKQQKNIKMQLEYNEYAQIVKRSWADNSIYSSFSGAYEAVPIYDVAGRLTEEMYSFQGREERTMKPFATIKYYYYDHNNIEEMLKNEQVIRVDD